MYYNGQRYRIDSFLNEVHKDMKSKYGNSKNFNNPQLKKYQENAQILQNFLQKVKKQSINYNSNNPIDDAVLNSIFDQISKTNKVNKLFRHPGRKGGHQFENEIAKLFAAITTTVVGDQASYKRFKMGKDSAGLGLEKLISDEQLKEIYEKLQDQLKKNKILDELSLKELIHEYFTVSGDRFGKIDNTGLHINYELDPNDELSKVFSIINEGTFSLKNYSSLKFNEKTHKYDTPSYHPVGLGDTTATKAIGGALIGLGYDHATIISATMAIQHSKNSSVIKHSNHLRFFYELTGAGLIYSNGKQNFGPVEYLIYNDPTGDGIYVKSSYELINEAINDGLGLQMGKHMAIHRGVFTKNKT